MNTLIPLAFGTLDRPAPYQNSWRPIRMLTGSGTRNNHNHSIMTCAHLNFTCNATVNRISDVDEGPVLSYTVDLELHCSDCGKPFTFLGMSVGMQPDRPTVSADHTEARLPVKPASEFPRVWKTEPPKRAWPPEC